MNITKFEEKLERLTDRKFSIEEDIEFLIDILKKRTITKIVIGNDDYAHIINASKQIIEKNEKLNQIKHDINLINELLNN